MNKFAKYVPEADKKKQREHIGAVGVADIFTGGDITSTSIFTGEPQFEYTTAYKTYQVMDIAVDPIPTLEGNFTVIWDGKAYENLSVFTDPSVNIPTLGANYTETTDTMPFTIYFMGELSNPTLSIATHIEGETHTVEIIHHEETPITIDPKYLPEGGTVVVNISGDLSAGFIADKTPAEVHALIESGVTVVCAFPASENQNIYLYHSLTTFEYDDDDNRIPKYEFQSLQPSGPYVTFAANSDAALVGMVVAQVMSDNSIALVVKGFD